MKIVAQLFYLPLLGAFIGWLVIRRRGERTTPYRDVGLWVMGYFTAIPIVYFGDGRFHAPTIPFMTIYAGAFIDAMLARRASGRPTGESERPDEWRQH